MADWGQKQWRNNRQARSIEHMAEIWKREREVFSELVYLSWWSNWLRCWCVKLEIWGSYPSLDTNFSLNICQLIKNTKSLSCAIFYSANFITFNLYNCYFPFQFPNFKLPASSCYNCLEGTEQSNCGTSKISLSSARTDNRINLNWFKPGTIRWNVRLSLDKRTYIK